MDEPITQSKDWQILQEDLGETSFYREGKQYHYLAIRKSTPLGNYLYAPYGPVANSPDSFTLALDSLTNLAHDEGAFFIRIEPQNPAYQRKFPAHTVKSHDLNPKETWRLDLSGDEAALKEKLPSRLLRYYKNREKSGIEIITSKNPKDIKYLLELQKALAREKNINTFSEQYLKTELAQPFATLYLAKYHKDEQTEAPEECTNTSVVPADKTSTPDALTDEIVAAGLVFDYQNIRYNLQGAQSDQGRKLHATGILTIQLILDAKSKGLDIFDFWGIAPEGAPDTHPWAGFTNFKKTFKGYEVDYAGTHDIILNPVKYKLYQLLRSIRRKTRL